MPSQAIVAPLPPHPLVSVVLFLLSESIDGGIKGKKNMHWHGLSGQREREGEGSVGDFGARPLAAFNWCQQRTGPWRPRAAPQLKRREIEQQTMSLNYIKNFYEGCVSRSQCDCHCGDFIVASIQASLAQSLALWHFPAFQGLTVTEEQRRNNYPSGGPKWKDIDLFSVFFSFFFGFCFFLFFF